MSYMLFAAALVFAGGIWFWAMFREQDAAAVEQRKAQVAKRKMFREQAEGAGKAPLGGRKRQRGFGPRG